MYPRIMGLEVEYGLSAMAHGATVLTPEEAAQYLFAKVSNRKGDRDTFLENGGRLYLDVGAHPEYATAECTSALDVVIQDAAGSQILGLMASQANDVLAQEGIPAEIVLWRNNVDSQGNSWGAHENYAMKRSGSFTKQMEVFLPFLVSRQIFIGAGGLITGPEGRIFVLSSRADHMWDSMSASTTRTRPIVNVRDEPHADTTTFRRLHVISGDTNMNEFQTWLKFATADVILRMIETGVIFQEMPLLDPIKAIRTISRDLKGTTRVELENGRAANALEIQGMYYERAAKWVQSINGDAYTRNVVAEWGRVLETLATDPMSLEAELDWVAKYRILDQYHVRHNLKNNDPRLQMVEMQYHRNDAKGLFAVLQRQGKTRRMTDDATIAQAMVFPPQDTRARLRGMFVQQAIAKQRQYSADWMHLRLEDGDVQTLTLTDPFKYADEGIERFIASL